MARGRSGAGADQRSHACRPAAVDRRAAVREHERDPEDEYFSDGLAEEIINALTHVPGLKVIARTSAFAFKGKHEDIRRIAEALGVTHVLEGSVRKAGNRLRVTAQLIAAADGTHLWSERYDRELADVFAIQDEIALCHRRRPFRSGGQGNRAITHRVNAAHEALLAGPIPPATSHAAAARLGEGMFPSRPSRWTRGTRRRMRSSP